MAVFDAIVIGAGWAGAVAARDLAAAGRLVLVLEARNRVGGRACTWTAEDETPVDLGCSWIHGFNEGNPARAIAEALGVKAHLPKGLPGAIYGPDGPLAAETAAQLVSSLRAAQGACQTPHPAPAPTTSLADGLFAPTSPLLGNPQTARLARGFARTLEVPLGVKLERASLRWAGWEGATNFAGSDAAPEGGFQALVERVLSEAEALGAFVQLGEEVLGVTDGHVVSVETDGGTYQARTVISTMPLGVLKSLPMGFFAPPLPARLAETVAGTNVGVLEKLVLKYADAWWPRSGNVGSYVLLPTADAEPTQASCVAEVLAASTLIVANFASPNLPGSTPMLVVYLSDTPARLLVPRPAAAVAAETHAYLAQRLGVPFAPVPEESTMTTWLADRLARGATSTPSVVSPTGERSPMDFKELGRPVWDGRLGFAGEHTDMDSRGSVAGAVLSGQREAARVNRWLAKHKLD